MQRIGQKIEDRIFIDASAFVSLNVPFDSDHKRAIDLSSLIKNVGITLFTSNIVIYETASILSQKIGILYANEFLNDMENSTLVIILVDEEVESLAFEIFRERTSKNVSMFDCLHFAVMRMNGITTVFGFDKHFKKAGFKLLSDQVV